jgi:hypothetical protein
MAPWLLFSAVPHLITMSNYCSVITNNTTAHSINKMNLRNSQDRLLASPIILARTNTIIKVIKVIDIPQHDYSLDYSLNELCESVAIFTNLQMFSYLEKSTRSCVHEPKCNGQFLAMVTQMRLFFLFHIMQNKFGIRHIPCIMHEP